MSKRKAQQKDTIAISRPDEEANVPDLPVIDDTEADDTVAPVQYEITSFGADYDAEGLVKRLQRDDIFIPPFQRDFVWTQKEASRFVESLLLGLPVPGVFLARESNSKRLLVIDGQQRLKTLRFFFEEVFRPEPESDTKQVFKLAGVQKQFEGRTYSSLEEKDRITLNDAIIHATIVKQDSPEGEQSSIYHIFERLNASGRKLSPQQIRVAIYHGDLLDLVRQLNENSSWRAIIETRSRTLKDQELILRFLALYFDRGNYKSPMNEFLNDFADKAKRTGRPSIDSCRATFEKTIQLISRALGVRAFRPERAINAAAFDSVMVGMATRLERGSAPSEAQVKGQYDRLLGQERYMQLISRATANEKNVKERMKLAVEEFGRD